MDDLRKIFGPLRKKQWPWNARAYCLFCLGRMYHCLPTAEQTWLNTAAELHQAYRKLPVMNRMPASLPGPSRVAMAYWNHLCEDLADSNHATLLRLAECGCGYAVEFALSVAFEEWDDPLEGIEWPASCFEVAPPTQSLFSMAVEEVEIAVHQEATDSIRKNQFEPSRTTAIELTLTPKNRSRVAQAALAILAKQKSDLVLYLQQVKTALQKAARAK